MNDSSDTKIYTIVDEMPRFPGCEEDENKNQCAQNKFLSYIYSRLSIAQNSSNDFPETNVTLTFVIEKNGRTSNLEIIKGKEIIEKSNLLQLIDSMPNWIPGKLNGEVKRVRILLPMKIRFE